MRISDWSSDVCSSDLHGPVIWVKDASRSVPVAAALLSSEQKPKLLATTNKDYDEIRERHANKDRQEKFVTLDEARANRTLIDWAGNRPPRPRLLLHERSEEHTSELKSIKRPAYCFLCLNNNINQTHKHT